MMGRSIRFSRFVVGFGVLAPGESSPECRQHCKYSHAVERLCSESARWLAGAVITLT